MGEVKKMGDIERMVEELMEKNDISCYQMLSAIDNVRLMMAKQGKDIACSEDWEKYREFKEKGNGSLEVESIGGTWTRSFAYGIETLKAVFGDVDFSRPFRVTVDYDPEQPKTIIRKCWAKEDYESYIAPIHEKLKG